MYSEAFLAFVDHFNRGEYRACLDPLEELWFAQRDDFHRGLIRLVVGLNQRKLGLDSGPRFLLSTTRDLLQPYHPQHNGVDLVALDQWIALQQQQMDQPNMDVVPFVLRLNPAEHKADAER